MEDFHSLDSYKIKKVPNSLFYIPEFITPEEEKYLLDKVSNAPKPKWTQLTNRRLQNWGGLPHPKGMVEEKLPEWLEMFISRIANLGVFQSLRPNHVLINEYLPGQGIMPHVDGPLYHPVITTINLGSHTLLDYYHPATEKLFKNGDEFIGSMDQRYFASVLLKPRSLLVVTDAMYQDFLHGIKETESDTIHEDVINFEDVGEKLGNCLKRDTRISLTIRHVPKTIKVNMSLLGIKR